MSDTGPENLMLRFLRSIDERLERLDKTTARGFEVMAARTSGVESRIGAIEARMTALEEWSIDTSRRLDRIERRTGLVEAP